MEGLSCTNCGALMRDGDLFCRRCGCKSQIAEAAREPGFCPKCGNLLRPGARFCDLCGEDCSGQEAPGARSRHTRRKRGKNGRAYKLMLLLLILLCCAAGVFIFIKRGHVFSSARIPAALFDAPQTQVPAPDAASPVSGDAAPLEMVPASPEDAAPPEVVPASPVSADMNLPAPPADLPESSADVAAVPLGIEIAWAERDRDGYSFLTPLDGFLPVGEILSFPGAVSGDHVRVRARPSVRGSIRRQLDDGVSVDVTGRYSSGQEKYYWFQIRGDGEAGWIYGEFLRVASTDSEVPEELRPRPRRPAARAPSGRPLTGGRQDAAPTPTGRQDAAPTGRADAAPTGPPLIRTLPGGD